MGQERLSTIVVINIEREFSNKDIGNYIDKTFDKFGNMKSIYKNFLKKTSVLYGMQKLYIFFLVLFQN